MVIKICKACNESLDIANFPEDKRTADGHSKTCNACLTYKTRQQRRKPEKEMKKIDKKIQKLVLSNEDKFKIELMNNFPLFLAFSYSYIGLNSPSPIQDRIASILGENRDELILQAPRGVGKSWITAIYGTWRLLRNPDEKIMIISGTAHLAEKISKFMRRLMNEIPMLKQMQPDGDMTDNVKAWNVKGCKPSIETSVSALGIGGQIVGKRATLVIADDVEIPDNSNSQLKREKLMDTVGEFANILIPDIPGSVVFLGTPQSMESIYTKLPYPRTVIPATVPVDPSIYRGFLDPWVLKQGPAGTPTDKVRFPLEVLLKKRAKIGMAAYMLQYEQDITLTDADRYPLKQSDFIVTDLDKVMAPLNISHSTDKDNIIQIDNIGWNGDYLYKASWVDTSREKYDKIIMTVDPSGRGTDETTWAIVGTKNGYIFVLDVGGTHLGYTDEALEIIANKAKEYKVNKIIPEANFGDGMFGNLLKPVLNRIYPCQIVDDYKVSGQKEVRIINNIEPVLNNRKLVIDKTLVENDIKSVMADYKREPYSLIYQLTHITTERNCLEHDDKLDVLAMALENVKKTLKIDSDVENKKRKEAEILKFLEENVYGRHKKKHANMFRRR